MGPETMPSPSDTERGRIAAERSRADREWEAQVAEESVQAGAKQEVIAIDSEREIAKANAEAEVQTMRETVAADKARRAIVSAKVKALMAMVGGPTAGENAAETATMIQDLKTAQGEFRDLDVVVLRSEQALAAREADYRKDFPESVN